ncbi:MAG: DUF6048 family protein [Limnohabitans sp.]|nr:DUF6048 family protein [Limnohabitans sp.]
MKHTLKYSFSLLVLLFSVVGVAQNSSVKEQSKSKDTIKKTDRYGLRVGLDISKLARSFYDKNYKGLELVGDYRITKNNYIALELGNENKTTDDTRVNFTTKGTYIKAGFDHNFYQNWLNMENMIHIGLRYSASSFSQELNTYKIYDTSTYFPTVPAVVSGTKYDGLSAQWVEVVAGIKAKLFNNLYAGISVRLNYLVSQTEPENFANLYIPGYNRTYDGQFGAGWNYTISYFIPLYKKK